MNSPPNLPWWRFTRALVPAAVSLALLIGCMIYLVIARTRAVQESDEGVLHEWIDESRVFRKSLPDLAREYVARADERAAVQSGADDPWLRLKREEIQEQLKAMADPLRMFPNQLPLFPEIYVIRVDFPNARSAVNSIVWTSPTPRPQFQTRGQVRELTHPVTTAEGKVTAVVVCEYRMHAFNRLQRDEERLRSVLWIGGGVILAGSASAFVWVYFFLRRERNRELRQVQLDQEKEHAQMIALEAKVEKQEAEHAAEEARRLMLEQSVDAARAEARAAEAERNALEMKSQLHVGIGIMAGSYAHNIKNLLVRPNDLISRLLEKGSSEGERVELLNEVRSTLGTVTDRLQEILRTVRRDPNRTAMATFDLNELTRGIEHNWLPIARDRWKLNLRIDVPAEPAVIHGDPSHLQQAVENLLFNARDATFEMRNQLRDSARSVTDTEVRKVRLLESAAWRGECTLTIRVEPDEVILEVRDNGIGMSDDVRSKCLETHFSTKRNNALYEGYNAGSGLGLSFVAMVLKNHEASLEIVSEPNAGALFRVRFPRYVAVGIA